VADGKIKVRIHAETWTVGSRQERTIEVDAEEWEDMTPEERDELCREAMFGSLVEWGYEVVEKEADRG
jgi:hypothetical protein